LLALLGNASARACVPAIFATLGSALPTAERALAAGPLTVDRDTALAGDFAGDRRGDVEVGRLDLRVAMGYLLSDSAKCEKKACGWRRKNYYRGKVRA
jgi:hypothetical protein